MIMQLDAKLRTGRIKFRVDLFVHLGPNNSKGKRMIDLSHDSNVEQ